MQAIRQFGETALGPAVGETALRAPSKRLHAFLV
jgi:hypothetical protein